MAKVTSKRQVTIPKAVADAHGIEPGTKLEFESADDTIRVRILDPKRRAGGDTSPLRWRLRSFDQATARQRERDERFRERFPELLRGDGRGWTRDELYGDRGLAR